jgi:hypothetical protein
MKLQILPNEEYLMESKDCPTVGRSYYLEDAETGTGKQNRAFHGLIQEYWKSRQHSYKVTDFNDFRNQIKRSLGQGFESYVYAELEATVINSEVFYRSRIRGAKKFMDIPEHIRKDPDMKQMIRGKLKSWADYTKRQRIRCIDNLITEMDEVGVNTKKYHEIREGMEEKNGSIKS